MIRIRIIAFITTLPVFFTGCGGDYSELSQQLDAIQAKPSGSIEAAPKPKAFSTFTYSASTLRNPFQPPVKIDLSAKLPATGKKVRPDETRVKQFLEGFNIESFSMVGTLKNDASNFGLVKSTSGVYRLKSGDYIGKNHGKVMSISESEISVMEIIPDGHGEWIERARSIELKEKTATNG